MARPGNARRLTYRCLLAIELTIVGLLLAGGCYSKQNYHVLSSPTGDEILSKCNVIVEGRIVYVRQRTLPSWEQHIFCYPLTSEEPSGPDRYDVSIDIDRVIKGDPNMPRRLQVNNCRPLTFEDSARFGPFFPSNLRVRIGYNHKFGNTFRNLTVLPLPDLAATRPN